MASCEGVYQSCEASNINLTTLTDGFGCQAAYSRSPGFNTIGSVQTLLMRTDSLYYELNTYSMKQPDLYYFETIKMTSQA